MTNTMRVAACQLPEIREDVDSAFALIKTYSAEADRKGAQLVCFPECYLQGYLCGRDAAFRHALNPAGSKFRELLGELAELRCVIVFGFIEERDGDLFNSAAVIDHGQLIGCYRKRNLLAGEAAFTSGTEVPIFEVAGLKFGINICYDTNFPEAASAVAAKGAKLIFVPANNMMKRQTAERLKLVHNECRAQRARESGVWMVSSDVTGERDGRISYGPTAAIDPSGRVVAQVPLMEQGMIVVDVNSHTVG